MIKFGRLGKTRNSLSILIKYLGNKDVILDFSSSVLIKKTFRMLY